MTVLALIAFLVSLIATKVAGTRDTGGNSRAFSCPDEGGNPRWPVKTLSDSTASSVRRKPKATTVRALTRLPRPNIDPSTPRIPGVETRVYRVRAPLIRFELEFDGDIHLRIADPGDLTNQMVTELPDTRCAPASDSPRRAAMTAARNALVKACGRPPLDNTPGSPQYLRATAIITGVGFFDPVGHAAPNDIELHPVLSFRTTHCRKIAPPPQLAELGPDETEADTTDR